jgi:hypothetical protein
VNLEPVVELELLGETVDVIKLKTLDDLPPLATLLTRRQELLDEEKGLRVELSQMPERRRVQERHAARALAQIGENAAVAVVEDVDVDQERMRSRLRILEEARDLIDRELVDLRASAATAIMARLHALALPQMEARLEALRADVGPRERLHALYGRAMRLCGASHAAGLSMSFSGCDPAYLRYLESWVSRAKQGMR